MSASLKILLLEENQSDIEFIRRELEKSGIKFELKTVIDKKEFIAALDSYAPDVILSDHKLSQFGSIEALEIIKEKGMRLAFILVTGLVDQEFAANIIKLGAHDFILKKSLAKLPAAIANSLKLIKQQDELKKSQEKYYTLFNNMPDAILISDAKGNFKESNEISIEMLGYTRTELQSLNIKDIVHENEIPDLTESLHNIQTSISCIRQWQLKRKNGSYFFAEITSSLQPDGYMIAIVKDITDRKLAEEQLKFIQDQNSAILGAIPDMIFIINKEGVFKNYKNPTDENTYILPESFLEKNILDVLPPDLAKITLNNVQNVLENIRIPSHQYSLPYPDGLQYFEAKYAKMHEDEVLIIVRNITPEKLADQKIIDSEEKYRSLIERVSDAFVALDKNWNYIYVNKLAGEIFGRDPESLIGKNIWTVFPEGINQPFHKAYLQSMETQTYQFFEEFYPPYNKWVENHIYPSPDGISIYFKDISERKIAEIKLKEQENQLRLFIEHSPVALIMLDKEMRYLEASNKWIQDYNILNEDLKGKSHYEIFPEISEEWKAIHRRCLAGATEKNEKDLFIRADGSEEWIHWEVIPWLQSTGEVGGIIIFSENISDRVQAEESILSSRQQLEFITDHIPYYIAQLDTDKKYQFVNKPYAALFNMAPEDFHGKYVYEVLGEDYYATVKPHMDIALKGKKETYTINLPPDFKVVNYNQEKITDIEVSYIPEYHESGAVSGFIVAITDITKIKKTEEKIIESENLYRSLFENLQHGFAFYKAIMKNGKVSDLTFISNNKEYEKIFGINEIIGKNVSEVMPGFLESDPSYPELLGSVITESKTVRFETFLKTHNIWLFVTIYPTGDGYLVTLINDISERKFAELKIITLNEELEQRVKERTSELEEAIKDLEEVNELFVGNEIRIIELKEELEALKNKN